MPEERHPHIKGRRVVERIVLGGSDGIIESIALTAALNGVGMEFRTILLAGLSFAVAGSIAMFFSNYLSARSEIDSLKMDMEREKMEIETEPDEERRELRELLKKEGYKEMEVDVILDRVTKDKDLWLRALLRHELRLNPYEASLSPLSKSIPAGSIFFLGACVPLLAYITPLPHFSALMLSIALSTMALFTLGVTKLVSFRHPSFRNGVQMALIGGLAALILYVVGIVLGSAW